MSKRMAMTMLALSCLACGGLPDAVEDRLSEEIGEAIVEQVLDVEDVEVGEDGTVTMKHKDGSTVQVGEQLDLPTDLPFALPPTWKMISSVKMPDGAHYQFRMPESPKSVVDSIGEKMTDDGWESKSMNMMRGDIGMYGILLTKDSKKINVAAVLTDGDEHAVTLIVSDGAQ